MRTLPTKMVQALAPFAPLFSKRVWQNAQVLLMGAFPQPQVCEQSALPCARWSFARLLERARLPQIRFHDLRHTCATLLLVRNVHPKYVQELLGHATVAITFDTYSHVIPGLGNHTTRAMEDVFS